MYDEKKRNALGVLCWLAVSMLIGLLALVPMVLRERRQAKKAGFELEWGDILLYGGTIFAGSGINGVLLQWLLGM